MSTTISTKDAPQAIGPYSQAVALTDFKSLLFVSGQLGCDPSTGNFVGDTVEEQTHQALKNIGAILKAGGSSFSQVVKVTVLFSNMNDFQAVNKIYAEYFTSTPLPARAGFACLGLPKNALIEIECIAYIK